MNYTLQILATWKKVYTVQWTTSNQVYSYPTVFLTFNCCSKCSGKTLYLKYSDLLYHLHFGIALCMVNNCAWYSKPLYFRFTVFTCVFTVISLYIFAVHGQSLTRLMLVITSLSSKAVQCTKVRLGKVDSPATISETRLYFILFEYSTRWSIPKANEDHPLDHCNKSSNHFKMFDNLDGSILKSLT